MNRDWTKGPSGLPENSEAYLNLCRVVESTLRNAGDLIVNGRVDEVASRIVYRLVHELDVAPFEEAVREVAFPAKDATNDEFDALSPLRSR